MTSADARADARITVRAAETSVESLPRINPPGQWTLFWRRFKRDRFALGSLFVFALLLLLCFVGYAIFTHLLRAGADYTSPCATGEALKPAGPWTHVANGRSPAEAFAAKDKTIFVLGADGTL